ncbi:OmpA/MotB family outer membrane protein (plasmid) [Rhizobium etli 8C-3]|uniref:Outer membrane protein OmpA-like peptidoglycan-associated protein n=2 Tax=Rhizobium TaxID=379 RepID=A0A4R3QT51_9HYPH|nr:MULTISPECIES: OmpA family protein [Rhizobium]APO78572.1 OmpA/MotB family outer membrane protein [Rhizobium etli 8C-3]TCU24634.1 outer membrane protein OmpA-like peptidoglycan-associated protein [Rhizobium azibense]TCU39382.1 outer membrane protein OmpA-like peptidoglycan-associated protein [Rhizobium azibense]
MKRLLTTKLTMFLALFFVTQSDLGAQEPNDLASLKERFQRQIELFKAARLGATRGLVLTNSNSASEAGAIPVTIATPETGGATTAPAPPPPAAITSQGTEVAPAAPNEGRPSTQQPTATSPATAQSAAATSEQQTYWKLPPDDQINVRINFDFDSAAIATKQKAMLQKFCEVIKDMDIKLVRIIGHTDAVGGASYNQHLSVLRAKEVTRFFTDDCNIPPERLEAVGVGEQFLLNQENPKADENRRVEFQAVS